MDLQGIGHALTGWAGARIAGTALDPACTPPSGGRSAAQWLQAAQFSLDGLLPQAQVNRGRARRAGAALPFVAA